MSWGHSRRPQEAGLDRDRQHGRALAAFHARRERDIVLQARFNLWISSEVRRLAHALGGDRASRLADPGLLGTHSDLATPGVARLAEEGEVATSAPGSLPSPPPRAVGDTLAAIPDPISDGLSRFCSCKSSRWGRSVLFHTHSLADPAMR